MKIMGNKFSCEYQCCNTCKIPGGSDTVTSGLTLNPKIIPYCCGLCSNMYQFDVDLDYINCNILCHLLSCVYYSNSNGTKLCLFGICYFLSLMFGKVKHSALFLFSLFWSQFSFWFGKYIKGIGCTICCIGCENSICCCSPVLDDTINYCKIYCPMCTGCNCYYGDHNV